MNTESPNAFRPTWVLVIEAVDSLRQQNGGEFSLADIVREVQGMDPSRGRTSIQPIVQGMTENAGKGPSSPCGYILVRVRHGVYMADSPSTSRQLIALTASPPFSSPKKQRRKGDHSEVDERVESLIHEFVRCVAHYDAAVPFRKSGQYELHRETIDRRLTLRSVAAAIHDDLFTSLLHETLKKWGIGKRASQLVGITQFREALGECEHELIAMESLSIEDLSNDMVDKVSIALCALVRTIHVVDNNAKVVAGTKTLHHLLPSLVPPMDRAWTGKFFGWSALDWQHKQDELFLEGFATFTRIARMTQPSRFVGQGWRTSQTKILDNALIGFCKLNSIVA